MPDLRESQAAKDHRDSRESRVHPGGLDSLDLMERTANLEAEVFQVKKERREAQVWAFRAPEDLQDLQGHLVRGGLVVRALLAVLVTLGPRAGRACLDQ